MLSNNQGEIKKQQKQHGKQLHAQNKAKHKRTEY